MQKDLIVFGEDWHGLPSSTQHIVRHLAKDRKVLWVNSIGLRQPKLSIKDVKRASNKFIASLKMAMGFYTNSAAKADFCTNPQDAKFIIVNPMTIPAPKSKVARYIAVKLLLKQLLPILKKAKFNKPILWASLPTAVDIVGKLNESALVYYCGDDFSGLAGVDHITVAAREKLLLSQAHLIMASSQALVDRFPKNKTQLISHGVDYELFSQPCAVANDLPNAGKKVAGFYGSISHWLDISLLCQTIEKMPDWQFIFIGKVEIDITALEAFTNVLFLGERAHDQLPHYSQHWSVSLLPFIDNAQIRACNPLKLSEYLAAGKPIVATEFPAVMEHQPLVKIVYGSDDMVAAILASESLVNEPQHRNNLQKSVKNATWQGKAQQVSTWLESL